MRPTSKVRNRNTIQAWRSALRFVKRKGYRNEIEQVSRASPPTNQDDFLEEYAWVVFVAGFNELLLEKKWRALKKAFYDFSVNIVSKKSARFFFDRHVPIRNKAKVVAVVKASKIIRRRGFQFFLSEPTNLELLPRLGETSRRLLLRNMGLSDVAKDDIWMRRLAKRLGFGYSRKGVDAMVAVISAISGYKQGVIDVVLWRAMQQGWRP